MNNKDNRSTGNPMLTLALLGPLGSVFGAPRPRISRVESKGGILPKRPR